MKWIINFLYDLGNVQVLEFLDGSYHNCDGFSFSGREKLDLSIPRSVYEWDVFTAGRGHDDYKKPTSSA